MKYVITLFDQVTELLVKEIEITKEEYESLAGKNYYACYAFDAFVETYEE